MSIFSVHMPPKTAVRAAPDPDRFVFVRDGFSFWAFLFGPIWMLWHGLWLVLLGYLVLAGALGAGLQMMGASTQVMLAVALLLAVLVGLEAPTLRRFALVRRRWNNIGIVVGDDLESAERRFFHAWTNGEPNAVSSPRPATTISPTSAGAVPASDIIGLFPQPGGWR
jgi:hypothetical protein